MRLLVQATRSGGCRGFIHVYAFQNDARPLDLNKILPCFWTPLYLTKAYQGVIKCQAVFVISNVKENQELKVGLAMPGLWSRQSVDWLHGQKTMLSQDQSMSRESAIERP